MTTLVQICTTHAEPVLLRMEVLLAQRHKRQITRRGFLAAWGTLRSELSATVEYQEFREAVYTRDKGRCTNCGRATRTVDHITRVARAPRRALLVANGRLRCDECHMQRHACLRAQA